MDYTLDDLAQELAKIEAGYGVAIDLTIFRRLFPPGELNEAAREQAEAFAQSNRCVVIYGAYRNSVFFRKKKPNEVEL